MDNISRLKLNASQCVNSNYEKSLMELKRSGRFNEVIVILQDIVDSVNCTHTFNSNLLEYEDIVDEAKKLIECLNGNSKYFEYSYYKNLRQYVEMVLYTKSRNYVVFLTHNRKPVDTVDEITTLFMLENFIVLIGGELFEVPDTWVKS